MFHGYHTLTVQPAQRAELERLFATERRPYLRERAAALLKIADGWSPHAVALEGLLHARKPDTVYAWLSRYERNGIAGLLHHPRRTRGFPPLGERGFGPDRPPASLPPRH